MEMDFPTLILLLLINLFLFCKDLNKAFARNKSIQTD